jgi:hypothetical protein
MMNSDNNEQKWKIMQQMMTMRRLDIAELERAYNS